MRLNQWMTCLATGLLLTGNTLYATTPPVFEQLQVTQCLASKITTPFSVLAENNEFKIINIAAGDVDNLVVLADKSNCGHFVNLSHKLSKSGFALNKAAQLLLKKRTKLMGASTTANSAVAVNKSEYEIKHSKEVEAALKQVDSEHIWQTLTHLTSYHNRSATKDTGVEVANWLKSSFEKMATAEGRQDTTTYFVNTGWYKQPSLVTVIGKDLPGPGVVLGAHMDTLDGRMPGAGDDGSGSSSLMEVARVLLANKTELKRPVYLIWYAAEERGLVGSQYVVEHFYDKAIPVKAALQLDMTGYRVKADDKTMWVFTDYTDKALSTFVAKLIDTYVHVPVDYSSCGYGCSDHASWTDVGVPAAFPCESNFDEHNPYIHSSSDTMDLLSLEHMTNFSKLALSFALELAAE